ncbi:hypothetical protein [Pseudoramibacter alactolyticus]
MSVCAFWRSPSDREAGHAVKWLDAASADIRLCNVCSLGEAHCVIDDDIRALYPNINAAEGIAYLDQADALRDGASERSGERKDCRMKCRGF